MEPVVAPRTFSGRYELTHLIARGGMAQVYRALDTRLGRHVALKVLFPELSVDQTFVERFRREAQAAANLSHPNIVQVYDWGEDEGSYFIAMELITGTSLATALRTERTMPATKAATIAAQVAAALAYAHRHGVVHRDVKPGNVLLTDEGQVKVTDFGIAQAVSTEEGLTMAGSVMGTAAYFSPEQAEGAVVDGRSDVYSLGVVLFEMLAGRPPFVGDSPVAVASMHVRNDPPLLRDLSPAVPEPLERVTMHALEKSPSARYQTADELRADLDAFVAGRPVLAATAATAAVGATSVMAGSATATTTLPARDTTLVVPAVVGADTASGTGGVPPVEGPVSDEVMPRGGSRRTIWLVVGLVVALLVVGGLTYHALAGSGEIQIPNFANQSYESAKTTLENEGLVVTRANQTSTAVQSGFVISSDPVAGTNVQKGDTVKLIVSSGPPVQVSVPPVAGLTLQAAQTALTSAKLNYAYKYVTQWTRAVAPGSVLQQAPTAGTKVTSGTKVTLTLLEQGGQFPLPDVTNQSQTSAVSELVGFGLSAGTPTNACSNAFSQNLVSASNPPAGTLVTPGSTVVGLTISTGACPVKVPNVVSLATGVAQNQLTSASLQPVVSQQSCGPGQVSSGIVVNQNPTALTPVPPGSPVTITVGCKAGPSGVP
jgi:serine/threonine-protein kinase